MRHAFEVTSVYSQRSLRELYRQIQADMLAVCDKDLITHDIKRDWLLYKRISGSLFPGIIFFIGTVSIDVVVFWSLRHLSHIFLADVIVLAITLCILICWALLYPKIVVPIARREKSVDSSFVAMSVLLVLSGSFASFVMWYLLALGMYLLSGTDIRGMTLFGCILALPLCLHLESIYWNINTILLRCCYIILYLCVLCIYLTLITIIVILSDGYVLLLTLFPGLFLTLWLSKTLYERGIYKLSILSRSLTQMDRR